jgi:tRNA modification GTPase
MWLKKKGSYSQDDEEVFRSIGQRNCLIVINKIDLPQSLERNSIPAMDPGCIEISALKDQGLDVLKEQIFTRFTTGGARKNSALLITNLRHRDALAKVKSNIEKALLLKEGGEPIEFIVFELREGLNHLAEITGETCNEDILQEIFSRFCIGK